VCVCVWSVEHVECEDNAQFAEFCAKWAADGQCQSYALLMSNNCARTCNFCPSTTQPPHSPTNAQLATTFTSPVVSSTWVVANTDRPETSVPPSSPLSGAQQSTSKDTDLHGIIYTTWPLSNLTSASRISTQTPDVVDDLFKNSSELYSARFTMRTDRTVSEAPISQLGNASEVVPSDANRTASASNETSSSLTTVTGSTAVRPLSTVDIVGTRDHTIRAANVTRTASSVTSTASDGLSLLSLIVTSAAAPDRPDMTSPSGVTSRKGDRAATSLRRASHTPRTPGRPLATESPTPTDGDSAAGHKSSQLTLLFSSTSSSKASIMPTGSFTGSDSTAVPSGFTVLSSRTSADVITRHYQHDTSSRSGGVTASPMLSASTDRLNTSPVATTGSSRWLSRDPMTSQSTSKDAASAVASRPATSTTAVNDSSSHIRLSTDDGVSITAGIISTIVDLGTHQLTSSSSLTNDSNATTETGSHDALLTTQSITDNHLISRSEITSRTDIRTKLQPTRFSDQTITNPSLSDASSSDATLPESITLSDSWSSVRDAMTSVASGILSSVSSPKSSTKPSFHGSVGVNVSTTISNATMRTISTTAETGQHSDNDTQTTATVETLSSLFTAQMPQTTLHNGSSRDGAEVTSAPQAMTSSVYAHTRYGSGDSPRNSSITPTGSLTGSALTSPQSTMRTDHTVSETPVSELSNASAVVPLDADRTASASNETSSFLTTVTGSTAVPLSTVDIVGTRDHTIRAANVTRTASSVTSTGSAAFSGFTVEESVGPTMNESRTSSSVSLLTVRRATDHVSPDLLTPPTEADISLSHNSTSTKHVTSHFQHATPSTTSRSLFSSTSDTAASRQSVTSSTDVPDVDLTRSTSSAESHTKSITTRPRRRSNATTERTGDVQMNDTRAANGRSISRTERRSRDTLRAPVVT